LTLGVFLHILLCFFALFLHLRVILSFVAHLMSYLSVKKLIFIMALYFRLLFTLVNHSVIGNLHSRCFYLRKSCFSNSCLKFLYFKLDLKVFDSSYFILMEANSYFIKSFLSYLRQFKGFFFISYAIKHVFNEISKMFRTLLHINRHILNF